MAEPRRAASFGRFRPRPGGTVRAELQRSGLNEDVVLMMWGLYDIMSLFAHPNVERLSFVMDEADEGGGNVRRTFRAGGTSDPTKINTFANLCVSATSLIVLLLPETFAGFLPAARIGEYRAARNDVLRSTMEPLRQVLARAAERRARNDDDPVAAEHARRLRRRIPAMEASLARQSFSGQRKTEEPKQRGKGGL